MKLFLGTLAVSGCLLGSLHLTTSQVNAKPPAPGVVRFYCGQSFDPNSNKVVPTTVVASSSRKEPVAFIQWKSTAFGKYTPESRCAIVSGKLQQAWEGKRLKYLVAGTSKNTGQGIICSAKTKGAKCSESNMLFTLASGADANAIIDRIEDIKWGRSSNPLPQSSGDRSIDIEEFVNGLSK